MRIKKVEREYSFYAAYLLCRDLIYWASEKYYQTKDPKYKLFLPTAESYGEKELSGSYIVSRYKFDIKNKTVVDTPELSQPNQVYDRDLAKKHLPERYYHFDVTKSEIFNIGGEETKNFLNSKKIL